MQNNRDSLGKFKAGNTIAVKPKFCPHCGKEITIRLSTVLLKKTVFKPLKNRLNDDEVTSN